MQKNDFLSGLALIAMTSLFVSCSSEDADGFNFSNRLTLTSHVMSTRTINQNLQATQIAENVKLGAFVVKTEGIATDTGNNALLTADGTGGFSYATPMTWPGEDAVSIYAYAPYNATYSLSSVCEFSVETDQSTDEGYLASDLVYGVPTANNPVTKTADGSVAMSFTHKLSKININIIKNDKSVDLKGATVSIWGTLPTTSFNMEKGDITEATGTATDIKAAVFAESATEFKASAIIIPQQVASGTPFVAIELTDGRTLVAKLNTDITFIGSKNYTYTVNIGEAAVEPELTLDDNSVVDWVDSDCDLTGKAEETYGVGDFILADGTLVKNKALSEEQKSNLVAVIFSTTVSEADKKAGYVGYAVATKGRTSSNETWRKKGESEEAVPLLRNAAVTTVSDAFFDLDGLSITSLAQNPKEEDGGSYDAFDFGENVVNLTGKNLSQWFMPSLGQMIQLMNNLGGIAINAADITLNGNGEYTSENGLNDMISRINGYNDGIIPTTGAPVFVTTTESSAEKVWVLTFTTESDTWKISKNAGKERNGRSVLPIVAYKLSVVTE